MAVEGIGPIGSPSPPNRETPNAVENARPLPVPPASASEREAAQPTPAASADAPLAAPSPAAMGLRFQVDAETGKTIVSVVDPANGEVIRQMPSEEALATAKALGKLEGAFVDLKV